MAQLAAAPVAAAGVGMIARIAGMFGVRAAAGAAGRAAAGAAGRAAAPSTITHHQALGGLMAYQAMQPRPYLGSNGSRLDHEVTEADSVLNGDQFPPA